MGREVYLRHAVRAMVLALGVGVASMPLASAEEGEARSTLPRVRVTTAAGQVVGRLAANRELTLAVEQVRKGKVQVVEFQRSEILRLEVSQRPSRKGRGFAIGVLAGVGAAIAIARSVPCGGVCASGGGGCEDIYCVDMALASALLTVPVATCLGYAMAPGEGWRTADATEVFLQPAVSRGGGVGLRLVVGF